MPACILVPTFFAAHASRCYRCWWHTLHAWCRPLLWEPGRATAGACQPRLACERCAHPRTRNPLQQMRLDEFRDMAREALNAAPKDAARGGAGERGEGPTVAEREGWADELERQFWRNGGHGAGLGRAVLAAGGLLCGSPLEGVVCMQRRG